MHPYLAAGYLYNFMRPVFYYHIIPILRGA